MKPTRGAAASRSVAATLKFGIAGWSYDDWRGVVYPRSCKDTLRYCAEFVDYIEINSTFYRFPVARHCESWVRSVEDLPTKFTAKVPQDFTHAHSRDVGAAHEVCAGFAPLSESGRLRSLLAQFSYRFERSKANLAHLEWIRDAFSPVAPITVEVRHASWATTDGLSELRDLGLAVANLDYPGASTGFGVRATGINGSNNLAYFRLHGQNADAWFDKEAGRDEVYDYDYNNIEVAAIHDRAVELAQQAHETVVIANNHFEGKAMKLVVELLAAYRQTRVPVPSSLVNAYPDLKAISADAQQGWLF
jgi:uncharacterized protein YecE (DUF72 family)